jgi:hypothetical protein
MSEHRVNVLRAALQRIAALAIEERETSARDKIARLALEALDRVPVLPVPTHLSTVYVEPGQEDTRIFDVLPGALPHGTGELAPGVVVSPRFRIDNRGAVAVAVEVCAEVEPGELLAYVIRCRPEPNPPGPLQQGLDARGIQLRSLEEFTVAGELEELRPASFWPPGPYSSSFDGVIVRPESTEEASDAAEGPDPATPR